MEFDLQRFNEEAAEQNSEPETSSEGQEPLPEELGGLPEDLARETLAEWERSQPKPEEKPPEAEPEEPPISRQDYQALVDEREQLKAKLAEYQRQTQQQQPQSPQPQQPQFQPPQFQITPENSAKISEAITAEAMALSGMSADDVASLEYADEDDPRIAQWAQAKNIAQNNVYNAIRQLRHELEREAQQSVETYNQFVSKEFAEPDFKEIQNFARNDYFEQLSPNEKKIIGNSYRNVEQQNASPAEMLNVVLFYKMAKTAYRTRNAKKTAPRQQQAAPNLPRVDQLKGTAGTSDGQLSTSDIEKLLEGDFTKLDEKTRKLLLGYNT